MFSLEKKGEGTFKKRTLVKEFTLQQLMTYLWVLMQILNWFVFK